MLDARARQRFARNRGALVGLALVALLVAFAVVGPWVAPHDPYTSDFVRGVAPGDTPAPPSAAFPLGADRLFRDELARLAYGGRLSLLIGISATLIAMILGAAVGVTAGYFEGTPGARVPYALPCGLAALFVALVAGKPAWGLAALASSLVAMIAGYMFRVEALRRGPRVNLDTALMRVVDVGLCFPFLLLVLAIGAALDRTTATTILVTLGVTGWLGTARIVRAKTMQVRHEEYVEAARALGQSTPRILVRHVLPNVAAPVLVVGTLSVAQMIIAESALSYLGVGIAPPTPTWGHMLFDGQDYFQTAPWLLIAPATAILVAVLGFNLLGDGLRDALDPK